jgi:hypothetical protein
MPQSPRFALAVVALFAFVSAPSIARGDSWLPLATGTQWEYRGVGGAHQVEMITGQTDVRGRVVAVKSYSEGPDAGLNNYWLLDTDGSVLLAGFLNPSSALALAYEPPIRYLPVPPEAGPQPVQHIVAHDLSTDSVVFEFDIQMELTGNVVLTLPAGTYQAVGVGQVPPPAGQALTKGMSFTLDGRPLPRGDALGSAVTPSDWYSYGVGDVMYQSNDLFELVSFGSPTATASSSWGAIKRLYR